MSCRIINSPLTGKEVTSKTWDDIYSLVNSEEIADRIYENLLTKEYLEFFGDWVNVPKLLNKAHELIQGKNTIMASALKDRAGIEEGLHGIAIQMNSSESEARTTVRSVGQEVADIALQLFPNAKVGDAYEPLVSKIVTEDGEPLMLYHGTPAGEFNEFSLEKAGSWTRTASKGIYFSDSYKTAEGYSQIGIDWDTIGPEAYKAAKTDHVFPVFINGRHLKIVDDVQGIPGEGDTVFRSKYAFDDTSHFRLAADIAHQYVVFNPSQIKSVFNNGQFSSESSNIYQQVEGTESSKASPETLAKVRAFNKRIGVNEQTLESIVVNGQRVDANGVADTLRGIISIASGREDIALTEESMHIVESIIQQTHPALHKKMMSAISSYNLYSAVFNDYKDVYKTADGKPDVVRIKREAIAKLLTEVLINKAEGITEKPELLAQTKTWWQQIIDWFKGLITKAGFNPFEEVAGSVLNGSFKGDVSNLSGGEFYQIADDLKAKTQPLWDKLEQEQRETLKVIDRARDINEYQHNNVKVANRVSDLVKEASAKKFGVKRVQQQEKSPLSIWLANTGTNGHADIEDIVGRWTNSDGFLLDIPKQWDGISQIDTISKQGASPIYRMLEANVVARMKEYPVGTRFRVETTLYDPKRDLAGTVDFMAIYPTPEGDVKVDILDWKFKNINLETGKDILTTTMDDYNVQMSQYKKMLQDVYGQNSFGRLRMIPIALSVSGVAGGNFTLRDVTIGNVNAKAEEYDVLLPVPSREESTGDPKIDRLITQLFKRYDSLVGQKYTQEQRRIVNEEMNNIYATIRHIQAKGEFEGLATLLNIYNTDAEQLIAQMEDFSKRDFDNVISSQLADKIATLKAILLDYKDLDIIFDEPTDEMRKVAEKARRLLEDLNAADRIGVELITNHYRLGEAQGFSPFMAPQPSTKGFIGSVRPAFRQKFTGALVFDKLISEVNATSESDWRNEMHSLESIQEGIKEWSKGKDSQAYTKLIIKDGTNQLVDQYSREFYDTLKKKIEAGDANWLEKNIDLAAFQKWATEEQKRQLAELESNPHVYGSRKEVLRESILDATDLSRETAWTNYKNLKNFPSEKWYSKEYQELKKNPQVMALYDYIVGWNKKAAEWGYIQHSNSRTFLPSLYKGTVEKMLFGGSWRPMASLMRSISMNPDMVGEGMYNPHTHQLINSVPIYFTRDLGEEKTGKDGKVTRDYSQVSRDLIKNIALYVQSSIEYRNKIEVEGQVNQILRMEKAKESLPTNMFGAVTGEEAIGDNTKNSNILEKLVEGNFYGHKNIASDFTDTLLGSPAKAWNKLVDKMPFLPASMKVDEETAKEKVSSQRLWEKLSRMQQLRILGINVGSSLVQFLGGNIQAFVSAGRYWTKTEFFGAEMKHAAHTFYKDPALEIEMIKEMMPLSDEMRLEINKMTSNPLLRHSFSDLLMLMMRKMDEQVQYANYRAMIDNAIVIDGKLVNAREYYRNTPEYKARYTSGNLKELEKGFDAAVQKLKDEYGLLKLSSLDDKGRLVMPIPIKDRSVLDYRTLIRNVGSNMAGNIMPGHETTARMNAITRSMFMFKNWIPNQMEVRFSELKYNAGIGNYEWGRARMFVKVLNWNLVKSVKNVNGIIKGNAHGVAVLEKLYNDKKADYEKKTGQKLNMDSAAFNDMVRENIKNEWREIMTAMVLLGILISAKQALPPDKDEDAFTKGWYNYSLRNIDKINDELFFYYNPLSFQQMLNGSMFPALAVISDAARLFTDSIGELFGEITDDEERKKKNHPSKYLFRTFPVSRQLLEYASLANPEIAQAMGIHFSPQFAIK